MNDTIRYCYWVSPSQETNTPGFLPSIIKENQKGHFVCQLNKDDPILKYSKTIEEAEALVLLLNNSLELSEKDVLEIIGSSM